MAGEFQYASAIWAVTSSLAVMALGAWSLAGGRTRARGALAFGLFALSWGVLIACGNLVAFAQDARLASILIFGSVVGHTLGAYFLVEFATAQLTDASRWTWKLVRGGTITIAIAATLTILFLPELILARVEAVASRPALYSMGPLHLPLVLTPFFLAFGVAAVALHRAYTSAPTPRTAGRVAALLMGLGLYIGFAAGNNFVFFAGSWLLYGGSSTAWLVTVFGILSAIVATLGWNVYQRSRVLGDRAERRTARFVAATLLIPMVAGGLEGILALQLLPQFETVGLWRLLGVSIIAYGLARWRLFDLPQRATRTAAKAAGASGSIAGGAAVYGVGAMLSTGFVVPAIAAFLVVGATFIPGVRLARRIFERLTKDDSESNADALYGQRVDAYRAALENSYARKSVEEDEDFLAALREKFGINEGEDRLLRYYARSAVLVPREGDAGAVYERLRLLGEGGAGRTWLARDRIRDRLVVLKEPLGTWQREPALREAILREARLAARVRHANVITVEEVIEDKGTPIIVMEFMDGGSLAEHLRERGVLPWREAIEMTVGIARGVEAIHQNGIVHRDLKPSNVLLANGNKPKVADFGIAIPSSGDKTVVDGSTSFAGTLAYVSPEVRLGAVGDRRSDVYSLGVILHECLYGSPPGPRAPVLADNDVPAGVSGLLARTLANEPATRPATARAFVDELLAVMRQ